MTKLIGLRTDHLPIDQPKQSARFVLNGVLDSPDGDVMNYQNELGTELSHLLPDGYKPVGKINLPDNDVAIFSTDGTNSEIGIFNAGTYTAIVNTPCLNFNTNHLIKGVYKILNGCDRVIYWQDGFNPDRQFNLDDPEEYQDSTGVWDCNLFKLNPDYLVPVISDVVVNNTGGSLEAGAYAFAVEILDDNLNSVTVGLGTNYIPVYDDNTNTTYAGIQGSFSSSTNTTEGGVSSTSKSFTLTLDNLDTRFTYARLLVSVKTTGKFFAEEAYELTDYIPISKARLEFTFNSLDNAVRTDIERLRIRNPKYSTSRAMIQVDGRLVRANLTENSRDYTGYQLAANSITTQWTKASEYPEDIEAGLNTKNPISYFKGNTFIGDEVYAFGIVFVYQDGSFSPVFHIPGREANDSDLQELDVIEGLTAGNNVSENDVQHLGLEIGDTVARWKFENTSSGVLGGNMAYHQSESTYPLDTDCNGAYVYGDLAGTPIRHHRFPDRRRVPVQFLDSLDRTRLNKFGVEFSNITYPDTDITGHFFVKAKRTNSDKTVIDNGYLFGYLNPAGSGAIEEYEFSSEISRPATTTANIENGTIWALSSPRTFGQVDNNIDYVSPIRFYEIDTDPGVSFSEAKDYNSGSIDIQGFTYTMAVQANGVAETRHRQVLNQYNVAPNSTLNGVFDQPVINSAYSNTRSVVELNADLVDIFDYPTTQIYAVSMKRVADPYSNLFQLQYEPITSILTLSDAQESYLGGGFVNHFDFVNVRSLFNATVGILGQDTEFRVFSEYIRGIWVDSDINYELRVAGTDCNIVYGYPNSLPDYVLSKLTTFDGSNWVLRPGLCTEYYNYNRDYDWAFGGEIFLPISFNFDYCSECLNKYPNRIAWSPKNFSEEKSDAYRINLVNDYTVAGEDTGEITTLHYDKNRMLVLTRNSCLLMSPNPRVINTDIDTAYIGTGDFLGIPPAEFAKVDYGFGGCQGRLASCNTEYGFFWCDQQAGRVFAFNGQVDELSSKQYGNYNFFRQDLPEVYPNSTDSVVANAGIQLAYDPYYKRVIVHKADFREIVRNPSDFSNTQEYENLSWTMSFSPEFKTWISFHSWQPEFMFSDRTRLYTTTGNKIWSHSNFISSFYELDPKFIIEYVEANGMTTDLDVVAYYSQTLTSTGLDKPYPTFSSIWCYSNDQSTGEQVLVPKSDYPGFWSNSQKTVAHAEENYRVSGLRDISNGNTVYSTAWEDRRSSYVGKQGYVDKVPANTSNVSQWNLVPLKNKYHIIRLGYTGTDRIILNLTETVTKPSIL